MLLGGLQEIGEIRAGAGVALPQQQIRDFCMRIIKLPGKVVDVGFQARAMLVTRSKCIFDGRWGFSIAGSAAVTGGKFCFQIGNFIAARLVQ